MARGKNLFANPINYFFIDVTCPQPIDRHRGTLLLVVTSSRAVHHVVKPQGELDFVGSGRKVSDALKEGEALLDMTRVVVVACGSA
jgi:hypothetical protein